MFSKRTSNRTRVAGTRWFRFVVYALIALIAYSPLAKAACEIEHLARLAQGNAPVEARVQDASPAADPSPADEHDSCCAEDSAVAMSQGRAAASADSALLFAADFHPVARVVLPLVPASSPISPAYHNHRLPPPEPVFRRVQKLLF